MYVHRPPGYDRWSTTVNQDNAGGAPRYGLAVLLNCRHTARSQLLHCLRHGRQQRILPQLLASTSGLPESLEYVLLHVVPLPHQTATMEACGRPRKASLYRYAHRKVLPSWIVEVPGLPVPVFW